MSSSLMMQAFGWSSGSSARRCSREYRKRSNFWLDSFSFVCAYSKGPDHQVPIWLSLAMTHFIFFFHFHTASKSRQSAWRINNDIDSAPCGTQSLTLQQVGCWIPGHISATEFVRGKSKCSIPMPTVQVIGNVQEQNMWWDGLVFLTLLQKLLELRCKSSDNE